MSEKAYELWVVLEITNSFQSRPPIKIQNANLEWGKFHENGNKDVEISPEDIDKIVIAAGSKQSVSSHSRVLSPTGTEGTIDLYDDTTKVCTLYWKCPWASSNNFEIKDVNRNGEYFVSNGPWNPGSGALGNIRIEVDGKG